MKRKRDGSMKQDGSTNLEKAICLELEHLGLIRDLVLVVLSYAEHEIEIKSCMYKINEKIELLYYQQTVSIRSQSRPTHIVVSCLEEKESEQKRIYWPIYSLQFDCKWINRLDSIRHSINVPFEQQWKVDRACVSADGSTYAYRSINTKIQVDTTHNWLNICSIPSEPGAVFAVSKNFLVVDCPSQHKWTCTSLASDHKSETMVYPPDRELLAMAFDVEETTMVFLWTTQYRVWLSLESIPASLRKEMK